MPDPIEPPFNDAADPQPEKEPDKPDAELNLNPPERVPVPTPGGSADPPVSPQLDDQKRDLEAEREAVKKKLIKRSFNKAADRRHRGLDRDR